MNRNQARARVRSHLEKFAPEIANAKILWSDVPLQNSDQAEAHLDPPQDYPLTDETAGAYIVIDANVWKTLTTTERRDLIDHEVAHLIQFARVWRMWHAPEHGEAWASIYEELRSLKTGG